MKQNYKAMALGTHHVFKTWTRLICKKMSKCYDKKIKKSIMSYTFYRSDGNKTSERIWQD